MTTAQKVMRRPAVLMATGWCNSTLNQKIKDEIFPKGTKLDPNGRAVVWFEDEVAAFQQAALASRGGA
jgi:predicted DNA-binding transcriptional regulator AlpA